jgi:hypothetical protein
MRRAPFTSLDEVLAPETLSQLVGHPIVSVRRRPFVGGHSASGSTFLAVETNDGQGPRFVVKLSSPTCDWIVRATADECGREVLVWSHGLLDQLPPEIVHPVVACARDGDGWAILMRDVSDDLLRDPMGTSPIGRGDHRRYLDALAAMHVAFWESPWATETGRGSTTSWRLYTALSAETGWREAGHPNEVVGMIRHGWELFWELAEPDVADLVHRLCQDPAPLCAALARYPQTVVHGDPRGANIGIVRKPTPRVILLDWHLVSPSPPGVDLAWYLWALGIQLPVSRETTIAWYRDRLAHRLGDRFSESWWQPQMALSLLGQVLRGIWWHAWAAVEEPDADYRAWIRQDLVWWCDRAREGVRWL